VFEANGKKRQPIFGSMPLGTDPLVRQRKIVALTCTISAQQHRSQGPDFKIVKLGVRRGINFAKNSYLSKKYKSGFKKTSLELEFCLNFRQSIFIVISYT
jgi:hypothetical protein